MKRLAAFVFSIFILSTLGCGKTFKLKGVKATKTHVESTVSSTTAGTVDAEQQAVLSFGSAGRITRISTQVGAHVKRGQILAETENTDLRTIFDDSEQELKRSQELFQSGLVSKVALDQARKGFEIARANLDRSMIRAPFDGVVTEQNLELGEVASSSPSKPPVRVVDLKPRLIKGSIDEVDMAKVKVGQKARIRILAVSSERLVAAVSKVVPFVNATKEQDRTSQIELKFIEAKGLIPVGASADIEIVTNEKDGVLALPTRALLGVGGQKYVYVHRDGKLVRTPVKLGLGNYDRSEVLEGISEGDVAVFPSEDVELKDGLKVQVEFQSWP